MPFLTGDKQVVVHESLYGRFGPWRAMRSGDWKLQWVGDQTPRFYDLAKDIGESTDVAAANPQVVERLLTAYKAWDAELLEPRWSGRLEGGAGEYAADGDGAGKKRQAR